MINIDMSSSSVERRRILSSKKKERHWFKVFFFLLLLSFVLSSIILFFQDKKHFASASAYILNPKKKSYVYRTYAISFKDDVPEEFKKLVEDNLSKLKLEEQKRFEFKNSGGDIVISSEMKEGDEVVFSKDLIPVGHLYSLVEGVTQESLKKNSLYILDQNLKEYIEKQYGYSITVLGSIDELISKLKESDNNIGLLSFTELDYRVKILKLNEKYYLDDSEGAIKFSFYSSVREKDKFILPVINKNVGGGSVGVVKDELLKVNMGGVVAISRDLGAKMNALKNYTYPADEIGPFLADADLTHISNESSFVPNCSMAGGMRFCSRPEYIETLKKSGVDIVELTGNHNNDYGSKYSTETINTYKSLGWRYFGGGLNDEDASKILYEDHKGTKVAFLGYNFYDSMLNTGAIARSSSGANYYSEEKMKKNIAEAKENADIVIVTFQFQECYSYPEGDVIYPICYKPLSNPDQRSVFKRAIDAGANIVVGTQAHQPQTYEIYKDGVIYYGLGNLFFDQKIWIGTRQGLVLTHYFYNGKHIQTKLVPIYMEKDLKPRLATKEQGDLLLKLLKNARD